MEALIDYKNTDIGCKERKCPCRLWTNCLNYVDEHEKQYRIRKKEKPTNIHTWYAEFFRQDELMHDLYVNG